MIINCPVVRAPDALTCSQRSDAARGVTVIELLAVTAIMGLTALVAVPNLGRVEDGQHLRDATRLLTSQLVQARWSAIAANADVGVVVHTLGLVQTTIGDDVLRQQVLREVRVLSDDDLDAHGVPPLGDPDWPALTVSEHGFTSRGSAREAALQATYLGGVGEGLSGVTVDAIGTTRTWWWRDGEWVR